jgi:Spy/CpxP family protein refolding chaperone
MMNSFFTVKKIIAASVLAVSLPLATVAMANDGGQDGGPHCGKGHQHQGFNRSGLPPHLSALQLSDKQKDEIFTLMHNQAPAFREQRKERMKLMAELRATSQADQYDDAKAQQLADRLAALNKERTLAHARTGAKIYALLTPEQRAKAREFKWERHGFEDHEHDGQDGHQPTGFKQSSLDNQPRLM